MSEQFLGFTLSTCTIGSFRSKDNLNNNIPGFTFTLLNAGGQTIDNQSTADLSCVATIVEFEPPVSYMPHYIRVIQGARPLSRVEFFISKDPAGTNTQLASGLDLNVLPEDTIWDFKKEIEISHDSIDHTGKVRFTFIHAIGVKHKVQLVVNLRRL